MECPVQMDTSVWEATSTGTRSYVSRATNVSKELKVYVLLVSSNQSRANPTAYLVKRASTVQAPALLSTPQLSAK